MLVHKGFETENDVMLCESTNHQRARALMVSPSYYPIGGGADQLENEGILLPKAPTFDELKDFTLISYVKTLRYLDHAYKIVPFCEIPRKDIPYLILRHDIDISLPAALKMARIERDLGIRSTYFVIFSSKSYNVLEGQNVNILRQISKLGHEIGLHYYVSQYRSYGRDMKKTLKMEIQLLEHLLGRKVYSIARHGPWDRDPFATIREYINANHPRFREDLFVHDSARAWTPLQGLLKALNDPPRRVQLLTHPENWQEEKISREALLERFFQDKEKKNLEHIKQLKKIWQTDPSVVEYEAVIEKGEFTQIHNQNSNKSNPKMQSKLRRSLNYYGKIFSWYLINTSFGWNIHRLREIVQSKFGST